MADILIRALLIIGSELLIVLSLISSICLYAWMNTWEGRDNG